MPHLDMPTTMPAPGVVQDALGIARHAPSVWNRQPWQWRFDTKGLHLYSDPERMSGVRDPLGRLTILSCGVALHHGMVALLGQSWEGAVQRFPRGISDTLVATVRLVPRHVTSPRDMAMFLAIEQRRTETRPLAVPAHDHAVFAALRATAEDHDVGITILDDHSAYLVAPAARLPVRTERLGHWGMDPDYSAIAVLTTRQDTPRDWLRAGEALSEALLVATSHGLATCPVVDLPDREGIAREAGRCDRGTRHGAGARDHAQAVIRIGIRRYPALPRTNRRAVHDLLQCR
ncbi:nitroreductase family protein [Lolliginicoccus suaedae]|uniref:hypothetical protein n=1 Tax=Lolliginicoccus suaedae TaxID=2605429 RepID=UPI0011EBF87F|nr:hypothetical protein [Lolliginicoccus suaedae]